MSVINITACKAAINTSQLLARYHGSVRVDRASTILFSLFLDIIIVFN